MIVLHDYAPSGNCYKVRLLLQLLDLPYRAVTVDFHPTREHRSPEFLALNPLGQLPVLEDGDFVLRDAQAILTYIALACDPSRTWLPVEPQTAARVAQWLAFADGLTSTVSAARLHDAMFFDGDAARARAGALRQFRVLDEHLWFSERAGESWIASRDVPTIADIACFPYVMLSDEGGVSREEFPALRRWTDRVRRLPRFAGMPGIFEEEQIA